MVVGTATIEEVLASAFGVHGLEAQEVHRYDSRRIRSALSAGRSSKADVRTEVSAALRRDTRQSILALATDLCVMPRVVVTAMRQLGIETGATDSEMVRGENSWFLRHMGDQRTGDRMRVALGKVVDLLGGDEELVAFVVGAPSVRAVRDLIQGPKAAPALSETPGISAVKAASVLKHEINDSIIHASGLSGRLVALEVGQGIGDGSLRYRRHGVVVSVERDVDCRRVASGRVPHLDIPSSVAGTAGNPLALGPDEWRASFDRESPLPVLMFEDPISAYASIERLRSAGWLFNWLDLDPLGFAEASEIDVVSCYQVAEKEAVMCLTNGGWQAERYGKPTKMAELLASGPLRVTETERRRRHTAMVRRIVEVEAAFRIEQAARGGFALVPLVLYDGRNGPGGVVRSYYLLSRGDESGWSCSHIKFDPVDGLSVIAPGLLAEAGRLEGLPPSREMVLVLRFAETGSANGFLAPGQSDWLRQFLRNRVEYARWRLRRE